MPHDILSAPGRAAGSGCGCGCGGCDSCDTLQCLCRPRFFAGQLVTDTDFRRLDQYLVGKDRLHNRYLHGSGVVCGLEVVCNPCDDTVTVHPGYALGPCGEDIVVCADTRVDAGAVIRAGRRAKARSVDCSPYSDPPNTDCDAAEQRWILGICYDEQPARPVTSLTSSSGPGGCGCGGPGGRGGAGGCGCGTPAGGNARPTAVACEPTVICEGFRFTLTRDTSTVTRGKNPDAAAGSALAARVKECLANLTARVTTVPSDPAPAGLVTYCCELKSDLRDLIETGDVTDCRLGQRLNDIVCPAANDSQATEKAQQAIQAMLAIVVDLYRECICSALLPPCPNSCDDDCVPLATLTVRSADLRVLDVCNWNPRRFAVTMPMLGYWLGWLPSVSLLRQVVSRLCCPPERSIGFEVNDQLHVSAAAAAQAASPRGARRSAKAAGEKATAAGATAGPADDASVPAALRIAAQYATSTSPLSGLEATVLQGLGATDLDGRPLASDAELEAPFAALALARFAGPAGAQIAQPLQEPLGALFERTAAGGRWVDPDRFAELEATVAKLQKTVNNQARTITALRNRGAGR